MLMQNYQVDWEAILSRSPMPFIQSVSPWLLPPAAREALLTAPSGQGLNADSARVEVELPGTSAPLGGTSSDEDTAATAQNGGGQSALVSSTILRLHCVAPDRR